MDDELSLAEQEVSQMKARLEAIQAIQTEMGWRWFIAEVNRDIELIDEQLRYCDPNELGRLQGRRDAFDQIVNFEDTVDSMLAELMREDVTDASL